MVSFNDFNSGNGDAMSILIDMNGKIGSIAAQLSAIQLQLTNDKVEHSAVHTDLNKRIDELEEQVEDLTKSRDELNVRFDHTKKLYTFVAVITSSLVAIWAVLGSTIKHAFGLQ